MSCHVDKGHTGRDLDKEHMEDRRVHQDTKRRDFTVTVIQPSKRRVTLTRQTLFQRFFEHKS